MLSNTFTNMSSLHHFRAVIFDMDGLMLDTERIARQAFHDAVQELGLSIPEEIYLQLIGRTAKSSKEFLTGIYGQDFPYSQLTQRIGRNGKAHVQSHGVPIKPGLEELLDLLDHYTIPRVVGTSTGKQAALERLRETKLIERFDDIVGGDEVEAGKPAPDIFLAAADRLNQKPEHCLVLEDSEPGIQAAHSAGMIPIMIPDLVQPSEKTKDLAFRIVPSLQTIVEMLEPIFQDRFQKQVDD
jgi:beta-phosphoglucomutase-like phosphatase (HAD superfamily)